MPMATASEIMPAATTCQGLIGEAVEEEGTGEVKIGEPENPLDYTQLG